MLKKDEIFIPKRLYERMKIIYSAKLTVITAPDGAGKTTLVHEFIARTRPENFACKSLRGKTADECFMRLAEYITGKPEHIPLTDSELVRLKERFSAVKPPQKHTLIIFDVPAAAEMLFTFLRCAELLRDCCPYSLLILTDREYPGSKELTERYGIEHICGSELDFTREELEMYRKRCGMDALDADAVYELTGGRIQHIRFCILAARMGEEYMRQPAELFYHGMMHALTPEQRCSLMIAVTLDKLSPQFCTELSQCKAVSAGLDPSCFEISTIIDSVKHIGKMTGAIDINRHTLEVSFSRAVRLAVKKHFDTLEHTKQREWRICIANEYLRCGENFYAFCELFLAEQWEKAAEVMTLRVMSLDMLLAAKELMYRFITACPLNCKPIIPRLLRVTALLMLTSLKEKSRGKFSEIIAYLQSSPDYTERERRQILSYAYLMRTYEYFYDLGTMGNTIKTAYDLFTTAIERSEFFHSWTMYSPSVFCMIHNHRTPIKVEREQFTRYMKMYVEMAGHGYNAAELFNAESVLFEGKPAAARQLLERLASQTQDITTILEASFMSAICCMCLGLYEPYANHLRRITDITHKFLGKEEGDMGLLCYAMLSWMRGGSPADMWALSGIDYNRVRTNRYSEPFVYLITCKLSMNRFDCGEMLKRIGLYRKAAQAVNNEVLALCFTLYEAEVLRINGSEESAAELLGKVLQTTRNSGTIFFQALFSAHYPELFRLARLLPRNAAYYAEEIAEQGRKYRMGIDAVRSYELSVAGGGNLRGVREAMLLKRAQAACAEKRLDITDKAYKFAVLAASGLSNAEIAHICSVSEDSVKSSLKRTFAKARLRSRSQLKTIIPPIE